MNEPAEKPIRANGARGEQNSRPFSLSSFRHLGQLCRNGEIRNESDCVVAVITEQLPSYTGSY